MRPTAGDRLLIGLARCGRDGNKLKLRKATATRGKTRALVYACETNPTQQGCGLSIRAEKAEADAETKFLVEQPLHVGQSIDIAAVSAQIEEDRAFLNEFARMVARKEISPAEWQVMRKEIQERIDESLAK